MSARSPKAPVTSEALVAELKTVIARSVSGNAEIAARVRDLVRGIVEGAPSAARDPQVRRELVARWIAFNIATIGKLADSSMDTMNAIISVAESTLLGKEPTPSASGATPMPDGIDVVLEGKRGQRLSAPFLLQNQYDRALDVAFEVEPLLAPGRAPVPASAITLDPQVLQLPPKGQAIVHAFVDLVDGLATGVVYSSVIRLSGFDAKSMRLSVRVVEDVPRAAETGTATAARPAAKPKPPRAKGAATT